MSWGHNDPAIEHHSEYAGVLRITNPKTLQKWKDDGRYQALIDQGFIYAEGCGRFRKHVCTCSDCRRYEKLRQS